MGTRADFYKQGKEPGQMIWIGSVSMDGYPMDEDDNSRHPYVGPRILNATSESKYLQAVKKLFKDRDDSTLPKEGWPWPWKDSCTTDYAYLFDRATRKVWHACFGSGWYINQPKDYKKPKLTIFPDMTKVKNVAWSGPRSGLITITKEPDGSLKVD